ncbi:MAG: tetratricopeptide repeat protein [Prevotella sp.]|nr:tetratricopeptide repeat protein [Bacteroides sp.]MCM1366663.1 tetratricopeptide repeat protein [Prevotella sp.]MCM1437330.1 tetratricopeptide repeat protein [Prevotella sp.]
MKKKLLSAFTLALAAISPATAVLPATATPVVVSPQVQGYLTRARAMIEEHNYTGALDQLESIDMDALQQNEREEILFLIAVTAYNRGDENCISLLDSFASTYPASIHTLEAQLLASDYFFFNHDFANAVLRYQEIKPEELNPAVRNQYSYRKALCMIRRGYFNEARSLLELLSVNAEYGVPADYYLAYIDYVEGDYDKAYEGFSKIPETDKLTYSRRIDRQYISDGIEPGYYMTQIEFIRGQYKDVISHGKSLLAKKPVPELVPETERVIGESYFFTGMPKMAQPYLESYLESTDSPNSSAVYTLAQILYDEGEYSRAAALFASLTSEPSEIAQGSLLYLGQCAVHQNDDRAAAIAFEKAYRMNYDSGISEKALYNYASALMHGGTVPFSRSAELLQEFINRFPKSPHAADVRATLAEACCRQGDFAKALEYLNGVTNPSAKVLALRQQVLFQLGVEEQSNGRSSDAVIHLREASLISSDKQIAAQSQLWLGDALYSLKQFRDAAKAYESFIKNGRNIQNYDLGVYNLAYALYWQDDFAKAEKYFSQASKSAELNTSQRANAQLRRADCLFYCRDYKAAKSAYQEIISSGDPGADYASLRHATLRGLLGDVPGKLSELRNLSQKYPDSDWDAAALLEEASTLSEQGNPSAAQSTYREVADKYADRSEARIALLRLAQSYLQQGKTTLAMEELENIIKSWPSSEEAKLAHQDLRVLHATADTLDDYADRLAQIPGAPRISVDEMQQLAFDAAEDVFAANVNDYALLERYVAKYPDGDHLSRALYDIADGKAESSDFKGALEAIDTLLKKRPDATEASAALLLKGEILENHHPVADWEEKAYKAYSELSERGNADSRQQAMLGMLRCSASLKERITLAKKIRESGGDSDVMEQASFYEVEAYIKQGNAKEGMKILSALASNPMSLYGARAAVELGRCQYEAGQYAKAEKTLTSFTDSGSPHDYWIARGFILLADVYSAQGKKYLAKEYLESLRENYPGNEADIRSMIDSRLKKL